MILQNTRHVSSPFLLFGLLCLMFTASCRRSAEVKVDPRAEFARTLKGANVDGYFFVTKEDADRVVTSLLNPALHDPVRIDESNPLVIGYAAVKDKKANTTKTYQAEVIKSENVFRFHVKDVDLGGGLVVDKRFVDRPCPEQTTWPDPRTCMTDFNCKEKSQYQCEANRTCEYIVVDLECCLVSGLEVHTLIGFSPGDPKCNVVFPIDFGSLVLKP